MQKWPLSLVISAFSLYSKPTILSPLLLQQHLAFEGLMATRFHMNIPKENRAPVLEPVPDLTDFMNDWFFGSAAKTDHREYNLTEVSMKKKKEEEEEEVGEKSSSTSRLTQDWLEEAKRMVADSPSRHGSPSKLVGSPRFGASHAREPSALLERRDPLSRSARRHRSLEGIGDEILVKSSARHSRNNSKSFLPEPSADKSSSSAVQQWFSNILNPTTTTTTTTSKPHLPSNEPDPIIPPLPPKQKTHRKSRFQQDPPIPPPRTFRNPSPFPAADLENKQQPILSPPRNLVESAHRRSISSSTCSLGNGSNPRRSVSVSSEVVVAEDVKRINSFLKRQKAMIERISNGEVSAKAKIILSGSSTSTTSSMVAAICYAWLLENGEKKGDGVVVPVVNMRRGSMWKHKQAAWLFHHLGIDASALLFSDEVDLEGLIMARQLSILVIGQDVLKTNGEVGSQCTVLTDNYCEDAYNLLQAPNLKKLLLAGILLDTQNLNSAAKFFTNRDAEAVQLLLVGSSLNYRHELFDQLMQDHSSSLIVEAMRNNYGKPSNEDKDENGVSREHTLSTRKSASISPQEVKMPCSSKQKPMPAVVPTPSPPHALVKVPETSRGKNKFSLAKWFGFGSK